MSEIYVEHNVHHIHHRNTNYSMDIKSAIDKEREKVLFYAIIIIFTVLIFIQTVFFSYYIFKHCCENTPCKRITRKRGLAFELGELEHHLEKEELKTVKRLENGI